MVASYTFILLIVSDCLQMIRKNHQEIESCKIELFQEFIRCGVRTWETVINALEKSNELNIAEYVKMKLNKTV